jgi:hypothetical protein
LIKLTRSGDFAVSNSGEFCPGKRPQIKHMDVTQDGISIPDPTDYY